jgi:hypothetical protein
VSMMSCKHGVTCGLVMTTLYSCPDCEREAEESALKDAVVEAAMVWAEMSDIRGGEAELSDACAALAKFGEERAGHG